MTDDEPSRGEGMKQPATQTALMVVYWGIVIICLIWGFITNMNINQTREQILQRCGQAEKQDD